MRIIFNKYIINSCEILYICSKSLLMLDKKQGVDKGKKRSNVNKEALKKSIAEKKKAMSEGSTIRK